MLDKDYEKEIILLRNVLESQLSKNSIGCLNELKQFFIIWKGLYMDNFEWREFGKTHGKEEIKAEAAKTLCIMCGCFDKALDTIIPICKNTPIVDDDWGTHCLETVDSETYINRNLGSGGNRKKPPRKRVFIDMDGVLCEYRPDATMKDMMSSGYFASLAPRTEMLESVKGLIKLDTFDIYVLSAVISDCAEQSKREKMEWLDKYIPEIDGTHRIFTICGTNKADAIDGITANDILLDDHSPNLNEWVKAGGKAIKVLNECNGLRGTFVTGPRLKINNTTTLLHALSDVSV